MKIFIVIVQPLKASSRPLLSLILGKSEPVFRRDGCSVSEIRSVNVCAAVVNPQQLFPVRRVTGYRATEDIIQAECHPPSFRLDDVYYSWLLDVLSAC